MEYLKKSVLFWFICVKVIYKSLSEQDWMVESWSLGERSTAWELFDE